MKTMKLNLSLAVALAAVLSSSPALAQKGNGKGQAHERPRLEQREREDRRPTKQADRRSDRRVPPGWCQGRGNPHNTAANCGYHTDRIYRDGSGVWRDREGDRITRDGIYRDIAGVLRDRYGRRLQ